MMPSQIVGDSQDEVRRLADSGCVRIVGCGRWTMGDDQAGLRVARRLLDRNMAQVEFCLDEDPLNALVAQDCSASGLLIVVDAARADDRHPAGTFRRLNYARERWSLELISPLDTHQVSVAAGLELADRLHWLPREVWVYVLFGETFQRGVDISPALEDGIAELASRIEADIVEWRGQRPCTSWRSSAP